MLKTRAEAIADYELVEADESHIDADPLPSVSLVILFWHMVTNIIIVISL